MSKQGSYIIPDHVDFKQRVCPNTYEQWAGPVWEGRFPANDLATLAQCSECGRVLIVDPA
jgi:hypothetical protein